ncbi:MAG TPA: CvpA family protein [Acidimicrobiales bacterium]|nr:CvpA family protein [Acidimicrobiales bacterium]
MSWIDFLVLGVVALAAVRGYFTGALRQLGSLAGFVAGFFLGAQIAPSIATAITRSSWRPLLALVLVLVIAFFISALGQMIGGAAGRSLDTLKLGLFDRGAGLVVGAVGATVMCWLLAGVLAATAWGSLAIGIQNSYVLKALDAFLPPVPAVEAKVQTLFRSADFPGIFATIVSPTLPSGPTPHLGPLQPSLAGPLSVQKVLAIGGCASDHQGTGFYVGPHEVITNAHVVAGAHSVTVGGARAVVALFDPSDDLAVLRVPNASEAALSMSKAPPAGGTRGRVVGFPLDGTRTGAPAVVRGTVTGEGRDIYNRQLLTRTYLVVNAQVQPGNSGSPVLVGGQVAGVIVSKSLSEAVTAYAIPVSVVRYELSLTPSVGSVSTESCTP